jgi:hypothetical protein
MLVRRLPRSALTLLVATAGVAALAACNSVNTAPGGYTTGSFTALMPNTGIMSDTRGVINFFGQSEIEVGNLGQSNPGTTERGLLTFLVADLQGDTVSSAVVGVDECFTGGNPFATLGSVVLEAVPYSNPPGATQFSGAGTPSSPDTLTSSADTGFVYDTVTAAVAPAILDSIPYVQFRLRFTNDGNGNGVDNYVDFQTTAAGHCTASTTGQPVLILTYKN